jgi:hypothetical protein
VVHGAYNLPRLGRLEASAQSRLSHLRGRQHDATRAKGDDCGASRTPPKLQMKTTTAFPLRSSATC